MKLVLLFVTLLAAVSVVLSQNFARFDIQWSTSESAFSPIQINASWSDNNYIVWHFTDPSTPHSVVSTTTISGDYNPNQLVPGFTEDSPTAYPFRSGPQYATESGIVITETQYYHLFEANSSLTPPGIYYFRDEYDSGLTGLINLYSESVSAESTNPSTVASSAASASAAAASLSSSVAASASRAASSASASTINPTPIVSVNPSAVGASPSASRAASSASASTINPTPIVSFNPSAVSSPSAAAASLSSSVAASASRAAASPSAVVASSASASRAAASISSAASSVAASIAASASRAVVSPTPSLSPSVGAGGGGGNQGGSANGTVSASASRAPSGTTVTPTPSASPCTKDTDGDGVPDCFDLCPRNKKKTAPSGPYGCRDSPKSSHTIIEFDFDLLAPINCTELY